MQGVDLAIVELQPTLETLIDDGIQPLALAIELQLAGPTPEPQVIIGKNRFGAYRSVGRTSIARSTITRSRWARQTLLPLKICTYAHDINGQPSNVREDTLPAAG
ncbi:Trypsin domain protein [Pseudomonas amygdali pv. eriobotryae]|uniref:Trypsin domain protein n=2 Tax=Pseudomonas syringae group genomosp. 2 TaxID=251698 RepID=A0A0P9T3E8_PSEA0|nr:Trypsin domain protein [Pseudomonas amygdali pv. eriobotryae]RMS76249.1 Trypsin domain protein [Pseudomonas savastanoi]RMM02467.1 Trypsin domain protein [Pseudomonas amygdali pv. eriobotryae]RMO59747.1 Trypsin domain protein [Pseudomonas amygdali pv. eriobotryae]GFZ61282.1 hypothetical protein PSE10A_37930 [Pseudomonas amygdali pv. eriobotryae]